MSTSLLYHGLGLRGYRYLRTEYIDGHIYFTVEMKPDQIRCSICNCRKVIREGTVEPRLRVKNTEKVSTGTPEDHTKIFVVIVIYRTVLSDCISLLSLSRALEELDLTHRFRLLIYDNSPSETLLPKRTSIPFCYVHNPYNGGLFQAYRKALELSEKEGYEWLLFLDQDTEINKDYIEKVCQGLTIAFSDPRRAALVPKLISKSKLVSPARVLRAGRLKPVNQRFYGTPTWEMTAFNSGAVIRASTINLIGGLNPVFWLDYLDHWLFNQLYRSGFSIQVIDATLDHELSVDSLETMNVDRYKNILIAEGEFYRCCKSLDENLIYLIRLIVRSLIMLIVPAQRSLFVATYKHLKRIIWRFID